MRSSLVHTLKFIYSEAVSFIMTDIIIYIKWQIQMLFFASLFGKHFTMIKETSSIDMNFKVGIFL